MIIIKKSLGTGIAMLLLLFFSVTVLPLDFLHNHSPSSKICTDNKGPCNHTVHVTQKAGYCWVCAIHFDKTFTIADKSDVRTIAPALTLLFDNVITGYAADILYSALRGPPSE